MKDLFKREKTPVQKVCTVEPFANGTSYMKAAKGKREYVVCLCLNNRTVSRKFRTRYGAMEQMTKYHEEYGKKR